MRSSYRTFAALAISLTAACAAEGDPNAGSEEGEFLDGTESALTIPNFPWQPTQLTPFAFESEVSTDEAYRFGDVRLDSVHFEGRTLEQKRLTKVVHARILVDDGVDVERGGNNLASGQGIDSAKDPLEREGPATITPTGRDLAASLGNYNLTSIVVTREAVGTASVELTFPTPVNRLFFWERGNTTSPTTANSDILVETVDLLGRVTASHKLLRSEYSATGIAISTWNGSFASPSTPEGTPPELGSAGLALDGVTWRVRLTSVQGPEGQPRDDGPDYKVLGSFVPPAAR